MADRATRRGRGLHHLAWLVAFAGAGTALLVLMLGAAFGLLGPLGDVYFALTTPLVPEGWRDEWTSLPGVVHLAIAGVAVAAVAGVAGELLD